MAIKKKHLWRSRFSPPQTYDGITYIHYYEDIGIYAFGYAYTGMFFSGVGAWLFDFKFYPLPPQTEFINQGYLLHYFYWVKTTIHTALPFLYKGSAKAYHDYYLTLQYYGYAHLLTYRLLFVAGITIGAFVMGFLNKLSNPIKGVVENHVRGMKLLKFEEANEELIENFESENKQFGKFTEIAEGVFMSKKRLFTHTIIFGASGSGKSQYLVTAIQDAMKQKLKTFILDPKFEFTRAFYEDDGTKAILDPSDKRSHVILLSDLVSSIGMIKKLAAALIPSKGNDPMWSNAARAVFIGLVLYLKATFKEENGKPNFTWQDLSDVLVIEPEHIITIMRDYYPEALKLVGTLNEETQALESNATTDGIMINLLSFMGGIRDLARFWYVDHKNPQKTISLYRFMTDPNYEIKTIFVKPNDTEGEMSSCVIRIALIYCISLLDSPAIPDSDTPNGVFFLDEFHAPGKLLNELDQPVIDRGVDRGRSKQWAFYLATQNIIQLYKIYTKEDVDSWRETTSTFILTGAPLGETANKVSEFIGEQFIDKLHVSLSSGSATSNFQEHSKKVLTASELSSILTLSKTHIRYLAILRGLPNVYLLEKPFIKIPKIVDGWVEKPQLEAITNNTNRVKRSLISKAEVAAKQEIEKIKTAPKKIETPIEEEIIEEEYEGNFVDTGQHMDAMSEEEKKFYEEDVENEAIKSIAMDSMIDNHGITTAIDLFSTMLEKTPITKKPKILQQTLKPNSQR